MIRARIKANPWWYAYLAFAVIGTACYFFAPYVARSGPMFNALGLSAAVAILIGVRVNRPEKRLPWYLFALAQVLFVIGDFTYYTLPDILPGYHVDFPSGGDIPYISVYPLIIVGLLLLIHARNPHRDRAALIDALIIGVGVGVVSWVYLMVPYAQDEHLPLGTKALSIAYPLMDVFVLAVTARLTVDAGRRAAVFYLLVAGLVSLVFADSAYGLIELNGVYHTGSWLDIGWLIYYFAWGAAALHPSMRTLSEPVKNPQRKLSRGRLALLAAATLMSPVVQATRLGSHQLIDEGVLVVGSMLLFLLVVARLRLVVRQHEESEDRERALREAGAALVSAPTRSATYDAAIQATRELVGKGIDVQIFEAGPDAGQTVGAVSLPDENRFRDALQALPADARADLIAGKSIAFDSVPPGLAGALALSSPVSLFVAPLVAQNELAGLLVITDAGAFDRRVKDSIDALASQVALALEAANLAQDLHRRQSEARFRSLVQNSSDIVTVVGADATIQYQSPSIEHIFGYEPAELIGTSLLDLLHEDDRARVGSLLAEISRNRSVRPQVLEARWRVQTGEWRFVEMLWTDLTDDPNVGGVVLNTRDISERKEFEDQLAHQAFHDPITGLANRALFRDRVQHALDLQGRDTNTLAVVFMDLDDFKTVNDSLGHAAGDQLLAGVGERLKATIRSADTAARLGGDEFAVLLEHVDARGAANVGESVLEALRAPFTIEGMEVFIRASLGIAVSAGGEQGSRRADELLRDADVAMYIAKEQGKDGYQLFELAMHETAVKRLELRADLQRALENDEFCLYYQPVVELETGRIAGVEALIRWNHPMTGLRSPVDFVPLAEETGLIVPIGKWVVEAACRELRLLRMRCPGAASLTMSVNLSARQLQHPDLINEVTGAIEGAGIDPATLILEITESMMMRDPAVSARRLRELHALGVKIAVDDFGTGYSSLNYLRQFPLDVLKVDRSFVERMDRTSSDRAIAEAIIHLARVLNLRAVGEGIETVEQLHQLAELGCEFGQGFYMARPMTAAALAVFIDSHEGRIAVPLLPARLAVAQ